jgi:Cof subfamily protein (haloacid dehalogenase superfamily)
MAESLPSWDTHDADSLRRFASVRLVALDLDGTLLCAVDDHIYETVRKLQQSLRRRFGVMVTIATGRTYNGVAPLLRDWSLPKDAPLVLYNGGVVVRMDLSDALSIQRISANSLAHILGEFEKRKVAILSYYFASRRHPLFADVDKLERVIGWSNIGRPANEFNGLKVEWRDRWAAENSLEPTAILVDISQVPLEAEMIKTHLSALESVSVTRSGAVFLEIRPHGTNKSSGLKLATESLGIQHSEVMAVGDNDNDAEMLRWAGIGVTVAGASDDAVNACDFVCRHEVAKGAVEVLRLVKQAHRFFAGSQHA